MPAAEKKRYQDLQKQLPQGGGGKGGSAIPAFWTVEIDRNKASALGVSAQAMFGMKKTQFNGVDFGVITLSSYAAAHA